MQTETRGGARAGAGRKPGSRQAEARRHLIAVKLNDQERALVLELGFGNASAGVRKALAMAARKVKRPRPATPPPPPLSTNRLRGAIHEGIGYLSDVPCHQRNIALFEDEDGQGVVRVEKSAPGGTQESICSPRPMTHASGTPACPIFTPDGCTMLLTYETY